MWYLLTLMPLRWSKNGIEASQRLQAESDLIDATKWVTIQRFPRFPLKGSFERNIDRGRYQGFIGLYWNPDILRKYIGFGDFRGLFVRALSFSYGFRSMIPCFGAGLQWCYNGFTKISELGAYTRGSYDLL